MGNNIKDIQQIKSLIAKGKEMGFLTFEEVNKAVPLEMNTPEQFEEIIGIFDLDNTSQSKWTRKFLADTEQEGVVLSVTEDVPKSFLVCDHPYHRQIVYISQLNPQTLQKRSAGEQA